MSFLSVFRRTHHPSEPLAYPDTRIELSTLGRDPRPFRPTYSFRGEFIDAHHRSFAECKTDGLCIDIGITGWLMPDDALKLYELAYFAPGDVLELGCYHGLSTYIIASAIRSSRAKKRLLSIDLHGEIIAAASRTLTRYGLRSLVDFREGDGALECAKLRDEGKQFGFIFVDHSHTYRSVSDVCATAKDLVSPGGMCLFHDYNNPWNADPDNQDYGVWQAVSDTLPEDEFEFYGVFGCTGLFRRRLSPAQQKVHTVQR